MSWLVDKTLIKWREPREAVRIIETQHFSMKSLVIRFITFFIMFMIVWFSATLNPRKTPLSFPKAVNLSLSGAVVLSAFLWVVFWFAPSYIKIREKSIIRIWGNTNRIWKYSNMYSYCIDVLQPGMENYKILVLRNNKGRVWKIALDKSVNITALEQVLAEHSVLKSSL
jgi:hypothetical protein